LRAENRLASMDPSKLRNSCICGNTTPYLQCCGVFADPLPVASGEAESLVTKPKSGSRASAQSKAELAKIPEGENALQYSFRHGLHELFMALFPLRAIYQAYWERLSKEDYPHELLVEDPDYGRSMVENFFWDYFVQYSDARPILRTARELESKELRLAHDLMQWSFAPLWFYRVQERTAKTAKLLNLGNNKIRTVHHSGRIPDVGSGLLTRILAFRGREFCGHTILVFPPESASARLDALFRASCRELGVKTSVTLRPDVHCEEWRRHGSLFLAQWRAEIYDSKVGRPIRAGGTNPGDAHSRGTGSGSVVSLGIRNRDQLMKALAGAPECFPAGAGSWVLKHRMLRLSLFEIRGDNLLVTLTDQAFRAHVWEWLRQRLDQAISLAEETQVMLPGESDEAQDVWIHTALDVLNTQTPIQASTHDWGRRRLQQLLKDMLKQGVDITSLRRQLGL
jgi:hypothetical protein